jgi:hypothetical protein
MANHSLMRTTRLDSASDRYHRRRRANNSRAAGINRSHAPPPPRRGGARTLQPSSSVLGAGVRVAAVAARLGVTVAVLTLVPTVMVGDPVPGVDVPDVAVGDVGPMTVRVLVGCPVTVAVPAGVDGVTVMVAVAVPAGTVRVAVAATVVVGVAGSPATRFARISPAPNIIV